jgi:hypothetical protein
VTVAAASTTTPATSPVDASTPDGTSTATTAAPEPLICSISFAAGTRGSPRKPVPNSASTTTPGEPRSFSSSSGFASTTRTSRPAARSRRAATLPSPPLLPEPQTIVIAASSSQ